MEDTQITQNQQPEPDLGDCFYCDRRRFVGPYDTPCPVCLPLQTKTDFEPLVRAFVHIYGNVAGKDHDTMEIGLFQLFLRSCAALGITLPMTHKAFERRVLKREAPQAPTA